MAIRPQHYFSIVRYLFKVLLSIRFWKNQARFLMLKAYDEVPKISWSQGAEDLVLDIVLKHKTKGFYIDVGAHDPNLISITKMFYDRGWTGINIEANPAKLEKFAQFRPLDINISAAIVSKNEPVELFIMSATSMSTVNPEVAKDLDEKTQTKILKKVVVPGRTLRSVFDEYVHQPVDFLTIDIESRDLEALKSLEFDSLPFERWPGWILLENTMPLAVTLKLDSVIFLLNKGYEIFCVLPHVVIMKVPESSGR